MATKHAVSSDEVAQEESYSPLSLNKTLCISPPSGSKNQNEQRGGATPTSFGVGPPDAVVLKSTTDSMPRDASVADRYGPSTASSPGTPSVALVGEGQVNQTSGVTVDAVVTNFECSTDRVLPLCATTADGVSVAESSECDHRGDSERCITADRLQGTDMTVSVEETKCFSPVPVQPVAQMEGNEAPQPTDRGDEMEECRGATIDGCHSSHPSSASTHDSQSNPLKLVIAVHRNAESSSDVSATTSPTASTGPSINVFSNNLQISADNSRMRYSNRRRRPRPAMSQSFGSLFGPATPNVGSTVLRSPGSEFPLGTTVSTPGTPQIAGSSAAVSMYPTSPGVSGAVSTGGVSFYMEVFESLASICPDIPERLRIPMSRLRLTLDNQHELGKGQYGVVTQGELYPPGTDARSRTCTSPPPPASENLSARSNSSAALHAAGGSAHGRPLATSLSSGQISYDVDPAVTFAGLPLHQQPFSALTASFYNSGAELMSAQSSFCAFPHTPRANGSAVASTSAMMACTPTEEFALSAAIPRQQLTLDAAAVEAEEGPADEESPSPEDKSTRNARSVIDSAERTMSPHSPAWNPRFQLPRPSATVPQRCQRQGGELGSTSSCEIPNRSESWSSHKLPADEATIAAPLSQVPQPPSLCSCSLSASQCEPTPVFHADELQEEDLLVYGSDPGGHSRVFSNSCRSSEAPSPVHSPGGLHPRLRSGDHSPLPSLPISPRLLPTREVDALSVSIPLNEIGPTGQNRPHTALFHGDAVESQPTEGWGVIPSTHAADESERCNAAGTTALPSLPTASGSLSPPNSTIADDSGREAADSLRLAMLSAITDDHRTKNRCGAAERLRMAGNFPDLTSLTSSHRGTPFVGEVPLDMSESTAQGAGNGEQTDDDDGRRPNSREEAHMHECSVPYRHVAVKMYAKADLSSMKNSREGFCNEVLMASHLSHPCIAHVYGVSEDQEHIYLTIELADHGTLAEYIQKHGVFHAREMAPRLLADVVLALEYLRDSSAHPFVSAGEKTDEGGLAVNPLVLGGSEEAQLPSPAPELDGIVQHKDLKPQNLLLTWDYHVKLSDFGSACFLGDVKANRFGGSTAYLSPEVMLDSKAGPCSDLWALGCILCELMQGEPPFSGGNEYRLMEAIQSYAKGKTKLSLSEEIPAAAEDLIHQLLQPSPSDRLGSIERGGFGPLKQHPFFSAIDWDSVLEVNNVTSTNTDFTAELSEFLLEQEQAVLCAVVSLLPGRREIAIMGTPFETVPSEQPLLLVLTNAPRLMLLNPTASVSGEEGMAMLTFPWVPELRIEVLDRPDHVLISSTLEFGPLYLRDLSQSAAQWQAQLELVKSRSKDSKLGLVEALVGAQSMSFSSYSCVLTSMREAVSNSNVHPTPQLGTSSASNYLTSTGTMVSVPSARGVQRRTSGSSGEPRLFLRRMRGTTPVPFRSPSRASASARPGASPATSECSTPVRPTQCRSAPPEMTSPTPTVLRDASYDGETTKNPKTPAVHSPSGATASFAHGEFSSMLSAVQGSSTQIRGLMSPVEGGASLFSGFVLPQPVHSSGNDSSSVIPFSMDLGKPEDSSTAEGHSVDRVPSRAFGSAHEFS